MATLDHQRDGPPSGKGPAPWSLDDAMVRRGRPTSRSCTRSSPPSWRPPSGPAPSRPRPGPRCVAAGPSRGSQKGTGRGRQGSSPGAALGRRWRVPTPPSPATTPRRTPKKMIRLALQARPCPTGPPTRKVAWSSTPGSLEAPSTKSAVAALKAPGGRGPGARRGAGRRRHRRLEEPAQPAARSTRSCARRAQRLRRAGVGLGGLHPRHAARRTPRPPAEAAPSRSSRLRRRPREGPPRHHHRADRLRRRATPSSRHGVLHVPGRTPGRRSPRSTTPSRRSSG